MGPQPLIRQLTRQMLITNKAIWARRHDLLLTLAPAIVGGALFSWLSIPLPWMLGALAATIVGALAHGRSWIPAQVRKVATPVFGVIIGSVFSAQFAGNWLVLAVMFLALLAFMAASIVVGTLYFQRVLKVDHVTAFCAALPGGLSEVILLGPRMGADVRVVVLAQVIRVVLLVFTIPMAFRLLVPSMAVQATTEVLITPPISLADGLIWLFCAVAGSVIGRRVRLPLAVLTGPMLLSAIAYSQGWIVVPVPFFLVASVQVIIGVFAGCRFAGVRIVQARRIVVASVVWSILLLLATLMVALLGSALFNLNLRELVLALAPGGVQEMTLVALLLGADVAFVTTLHLLRISIIVGLVLPAYEALTRHDSKD